MAHLSAFAGAFAPEAEQKIPPEQLRALRRDENFTACEVFFTESAAPLSAAKEGLLRDLIGATGEFSAAAENAAAAESFAAALIIPHFGMISPWSSKAFSLLANCGLDGVRHIERGVFIRRGGEFSAALADRMTQTVLRPPELQHWRKLFTPPPPRPGKKIGADAKSLARANEEMGLALGENELAHLQKLCTRLKRALTEAELIMFAQANSEHCRHKIFNAAAKDGGESLMQMIRRTHAASPDGVITAFSDNAAVICAAAGEDFAPGENGIYRRGAGGLSLVAKAETHNHPTAISPFPGAATGSGGEIRDEAAAGRGAATRAGFAGFIVSRMAAADLAAAHAPAPNLAPPLQIMIDGPLGAANYCNEFGRPSLGGFFRTFESAADGRNFGFHKPLMLAGGLGHMLSGGEGKKPIPPGAKIIQLGGAGFRIGMGGGAASSRDSGGDDFASVQRGCAEMQRRAQEVIDICRRIPGMFLSLHDVGAGGLANAVIEMAHEGGAGARIALSAIPVEDGSLSPAEIWCNESQERYVLALLPPFLEQFTEICRRENCPFAVIGEASADGKITLADKGGAAAADLPLAEVLGGVAIPALAAEEFTAKEFTAVRPRMELSAACRAVLRHPATACKRFLISIGDRTVGGLTARDQMAGPWQTPVADCAAFFNDYESFGGAAFALGERPGIAALNPAAGARMAVAEALSNLAAAGGEIGELRRVKFSLNWLANCANKKRCGELRAAVAAAADFCESLKTGVVVGKDSLFMRAKTADEKETESPAFPAAAAFAPLTDARKILTPQLSGGADSFLMLVEPSGARRLGGGVFAEISGAQDSPPDIAAAKMRAFWRTVSECHGRGLLAAYHDRSDGGLWAAACEMAFAANCGISLILDGLFPAAETDGGEDGVGGDIEAALFCEEIGALLEVAPQNAAAVLDIFAAAGLGENIQTAGHAGADKFMRIYRGGKKLFEMETGALRREWETVSYEIARRRDCAECAAEEYGRDYSAGGGLFARPPKEYGEKETPFFIGGARPQVAVLREQGSNGQREMAAAFTRAGFDAADVPMSDLRAGRRRLDEFSGLALCGGFSFGDVLGAGRGWAEGVLQNPKLAEMFAAFFAAKNTFTFGACNGCQALSFLRPLAPDSAAWRFPRFVANRSRRFEARFVMAEILKSPSPFFTGMDGAFLPVPSSNAEGRPVFDEDNGGENMRALPVMRFANGRGAAETYPDNPSGGEGGLCGFCSPDGRITITMPHPERVFRCGQMSWHPPEWKKDASPWLQMFINARRFVN